jgi:hypothetical protein
MMKQRHYVTILFLRIPRESIVDIHANLVTVQQKIESCTEQNLELHGLEIFVVSQAKLQLPLQIEDASRPEKKDVCDSIHNSYRSLMIYSF